MSRDLAQQLVVAGHEQVDQLVVVDATLVVHIDILHDNVNLKTSEGEGEENSVKRERKMTMKQKKNENAKPTS